MKLYLIPTQNRYVRTQGEAKKLGFGEETDVPTTDKDEFIAWVNKLRADLRNQHEVDTAYLDDSPVHSEPEPAVCVVLPPRESQFAADSVLARMDNPGVNLDAIIETIGKMKGGYALKRVAGAVAVRFQELSN